jgi:glycerol-3-phosphate dehydrogenase subunit B
VTDPAAIVCDVCVVGSGMAGMSAALFAANRGLATVLVGRTGEIIFATGMLDLLGVHPLEEGKTWSDPWAGMAALVKDLPRHPYARLTAGEIRAAFDELLRFFEAHGLSYAGRPERNVVVPTAVGTLKTTYRVPRTMWQAVAALERRACCRLVDIQGLKGFSARQIADTLGPVWPGLQTARVVFPDTPAVSEVFAERLARSLELDPNRAKFADVLKPHVKGVDVVGLPAILGISDPVRVMQDMERRLGVAVFEIPTMPPGATGLRLKETFERGLGACGVRLLLENRVFHAVADTSGGFRLEAGRSDAEQQIAAASVILATGRFMGGGLHADRHGVRETLLDLPVHQPEGRDNWHRQDFLDPPGHPVNRAGLEIDDHFRPLAASGRPAHAHLFAAGSILAHQDWIRMKCGAGLAFATAYGAVKGAVRALKAAGSPSRSF